MSDSVEQSQNSDSGLPIWARPDVFPEAPPGFGWIDPKGAAHPCENVAGLVEAVGEKNGERVVLVWDPTSSHMRVPEEVEALAAPLGDSRLRWAESDRQVGIERMRMYGVIAVALMAWEIYQRGGRGLLARFDVGLALLLFLILGFMPWYQGVKRLRELRGWSVGKMKELAPVIRFETWLELQRSPMTMALLGIMAVVGLCQFLPGSAIDAAGLTKAAGKPTEAWRLLTAPWLHGFPPHWLMNAAALRYLGKRVEVFARWPHLVLCFLFSAWAAGLCSAWLVPQTSVGASGGLMGLLGFLMVFETLHKNLVPRSARRRLLGIVLATAAIGVVGFAFIDNAAHGGGLLAGILYAAIVFPPSNDVHRPRATLSDRIAGGFALVVLVIGALLAILKMIEVMPKS